MTFPLVPRTKTLFGLRFSIFILTEQLNGKLKIVQHLEYQRFPNVFSTAEPITMISDLHDNFQATVNSPFYIYFWYKYINGKKHLIQSTTEIATITTRIPDAANFTLMSEVKMLIDGTRHWYQRKNPRKALADSLCEDGSPTIKCGGFRQTVIFKGKLHFIQATNLYV